MLQGLIFSSMRRRDLTRTLLITVASALFGVLYGIVLSEGITFGLLNGLLNGIAIGLLDTLWVRKRRGRRLRRLPLLSYTLILTAIWVLIIIANMALVRHLLGLEHDLNLHWIWNQAFLRHLLFCLSMAFTFNLLLRTTAFLGTRSLLDILLGRFQEPRERQLAFLFLDVVGSTRLTERIGNTRTQTLIGDLFFDVAGLVERYGGEVHRYIGDAMVVTWSLDQGGRMPDILGCLLAIYDLIERQRRQSEPSLGAWVDLRAGINAGPVVVSEIGDLKRELVYFGDAINVAAGLQAHCKAVGARALIAHDLYRRLRQPDRLYAQTIDCIRLKGKRTPTASLGLFTTRPSTPTTHKSRVLPHPLRSR